MSGELDGIRFTNAAGLGRAMHDNPLPRRVWCAGFILRYGRAAARRDMA